jgi:hypothetical protein
MAEESSDALSARPVLHPAALVIMVYVDELPLRKWLMAHAAGLLLRIQQKVKMFLSQPVASDAVLPVRFSAGLR